MRATLADEGLSEYININIQQATKEKVRILSKITDERMQALKQRVADEGDSLPLVLLRQAVQDRTRKGVLKEMPHGIDKKIKEYRELLTLVRGNTIEAIARNTLEPAYTRESLRQIVIESASHKVAEQFTLTVEMPQFERLLTDAQNKAEPPESFAGLRDNDILRYLVDKVEKYLADKNKVDIKIWNTREVGGYFAKVMQSFIYDPILYEELAEPTRKWKDAVESRFNTLSIALTNPRTTKDVKKSFVNELDADLTGALVKMLDLYQPTKVNSKIEELNLPKDREKTLKYFFESVFTLGFIADLASFKVFLAIAYYIYDLEHA